MEAFGFTVISKEAPWDEKIATLSPFAKGDMISIGDEWGERALVARALFKCLRKLDNGAFMFGPNPKVDSFYRLPSEQVNTYFWKCRGLWEASLKINGMLLKDAPPHIKDDKSLVLVAVKQNGRALIFADMKLRKDENFLLRALEVNGMGFRDLDSDEQERQDFQIAAMSGLHSRPITDQEKIIKNLEFEFAGPELKGMALVHNFVMTCTRKKMAPIVMEGILTILEDPHSPDDRVVTVASYILNHCKPVLVQVARNITLPTGIYVIDFSKRFIVDFEIDVDIALAQVEHNAETLRYFNDTMCDNKVVVLMAVRQSGSMLEHASVDLKDDEYVVSTAIKREGKALLSASNRLRNDVGFLTDVITDPRDDMLYTRN